MPSPTTKDSRGVVETMRVLVVALYVCTARSVKLNWLRCVSSSSSSAAESVFPCSCAAMRRARRRSSTASRKFLSKSFCAVCSSPPISIVRDLSTTWKTVFSSAVAGIALYSWSGKQKETSPRGSNGLPAVSTRIMSSSSSFAVNFIWSEGTIVKASSTTATSSLVSSFFPRLPFTTDFFTVPPATVLFISDTLKERKGERNWGGCYNISTKHQSNKKGVLTNPVFNGLSKLSPSQARLLFSRVRYLSRV